MPQYQQIHENISEETYLSFQYEEKQLSLSQRIISSQITKWVFLALALLTSYLAYYLLIKASTQKSNQIAYQQFLRNQDQRSLIHHDNDQVILKSEQQQHNVKHQTNKQETVAFPKIVWAYVMAKNANNWFYMHAMDNVAQYVRSSGYTMYILVEGHQYKYIKTTSAQYIRQKLGYYYLKGLRKEDKKYSSLQINLLKLYTLIQHGGIWIDPEVFLFQKLNWIESLQSNLYVVNRQKGQSPDIFTFHQFQYNHYPFKYNQEEVLLSTRSHLYFIAAKPKSELFITLLEEYQEYLHHELLDHQFQVIQKENQEEQKKYLKLLETMMEQVISSKQKQLDSRSSQSSNAAQGNRASASQGNKASEESPYAVHYYKIWQMRADMFSKKLTFTNKNNLTHIISTLLDYTEADVYKIMGPMLYLTHLEPETIHSLIQQIVNHGGEKEVLPFSIYHNYLQLQKDYDPSSQKLLQWTAYIHDDVEQNDRNAIAAIKPEPLFPKIVWVYWSSGFNKLGQTQELCLNVIKKYCRISNYKLLLLDQENYKDYLSYQARDKLDLAIKHVKMSLEVTTKADLLRMLLLIENGGIWMDLTTILLRDLQWVDQLRDSQEIMHEKTKNDPKIFMIYNQQHGGRQFIWTKDPAELKQKIFLSPILQIFFIAAQPQSQFLKQVVEQTITYITHEEKYYLQDIATKEIIISDSVKLVPYLLPMVSIQVFLQSKQRELTRDGKFVMQEYGIWAIDSRTSAYKLETNGDMGFQRLNEMMLLRSIEYVEGCLGKHAYFIKLNHYGIPLLEATMREALRQKNEILGDSYYMKYLYNATEQNRKLHKENLQLLASTVNTN